MAAGNLSKTVFVIWAAVSISFSPTLIAEEKQIGFIGFFGQEGFDTASIRDRLPFHLGDIVLRGENEQEAGELRDRWRESAKRAFKEIIGRDPRACSGLM